MKDKFPVYRWESSNIEKGIQKIIVFALKKISDWSKKNIKGYKEVPKIKFTEEEMSIVVQGPLSK